METIQPPVRHPLPVPWRRWATFWAGPCLASVGLVGWLVVHLANPVVCINYNWVSAISTLRNIASCQAEFQAAGFVDEDADGVGEAGGFLEMSGATAPRGREAAVQPILSGAFRTLTASGEVSRSGYLFRMYLVGRDGTALGEVQRGGFHAGDADPDASERTWICYAWPALNAGGAERTFVVSEAGEIFATEGPVYTGPNAPRPGAAVLPPSAGPTRFGRTAAGCCEPTDLLDRFDAPLADGVRGRDGNVWRKIN